MSTSDSTDLDSTGFDLGQRLRLVRELNGLSQRELARRADVTNSNISMIEQGAVSPTVNSLARLLDAIPISLAQFFACDPRSEPKGIYRAAELEQRAGIECGIEQSRLPSAIDGASIDLCRYRLAPGSDSGAHYRTEKNDWVGWVLEGELELSLGARTYTLSAGDGFYLTPLQPYRVRNTTNEQVLLISARSLDSD